MQIEMRENTSEISVAFENINDLIKEKSKPNQKEKTIWQDLL